jgi:2-aminoadipate transaminase
VEDPRHNTLRLAFVTVPSERIQQGTSILGELIRSRLGGRP